MVLRNHIAHQFLSEDTIQWDILNNYFPEEVAGLRDLASCKSVEERKIKEEVIKSKLPNTFFNMTRLLMNEAGINETIKVYYVTNTVLQHLDHLKIKKKDDCYNWQVFKKITPQKITFILPDNKMVRMEVQDTIINFCFVELEKSKDKGALDKMKWQLFFVNRQTGKQLIDSEQLNIPGIDTYIYKLLCFVYLADNEEVFLKPGTSAGSKKSGKTLNNTNFPVTVINSRWNITVHVEGEIAVRAHWAIRWVGKGRQDWKTVLIQPFLKNGYTRKAKKEEEISI